MQKDPMQKGLKEKDLVADKLDAPHPLWDSSLGELTLSLEATALMPFVRRLHGDSLLWAGTHAKSADQVERCMVRSAFFLQQNYERLTTSPAATIPSLGARLEALPFKSHALDAVVLHHALETTDDPRIALREVTRVLSPGGRLLIVGFNPWSLIGLRRLYARVFDDALAGQRLVNPLRLFDWLTLLGYELDVAPLYSGYSLPIGGLVQKFDLPYLQKRERACEQGFHFPFGGLLVISAVKQALPMRMQRLPKHSRRKLAPVAYPRVSSWQRLKP